MADGDPVALVAKAEKRLDGWSLFASAREKHEDAAELLDQVSRIRIRGALESAWTSQVRFEPAD